MKWPQKSTEWRRCRGSNPIHLRDRREYSPLYYNDTRHALTVDQSHRFTQCYKSKCSMRFNSRMKLNGIDRYIDFLSTDSTMFPIKHIEWLQHLSFQEFDISCTNLRWVLYFISIFLDWHLGFRREPLKLKLSYEGFNLEHCMDLKSISCHWQIWNQATLYMIFSVWYTKYKRIH